MPLRNFREPPPEQPPPVDPFAVVAPVPDRDGIDEVVMLHLRQPARPVFKPPEGDVLFVGVLKKREKIIVGFDGIVRAAQQ